MPEKVYLVSFGLGGHSEEGDNFRLSGYSRPENWERYTHKIVSIVALVIAAFAFWFLAFVSAGCASISYSTYTGTATQPVIREYTVSTGDVSMARKTIYAPIVKEFEVSNPLNHPISVTVDCGSPIETFSLTLEPRQTYTGQVTVAMYYRDESVCRLNWFGTVAPLTLPDVRMPKNF